MQTFARSTTIDAPASRVFTALTDLDAFRQVMPEITAVEMLTEGPVAKGARWKETRRLKLFGFLPMKGTAEVEVTDLKKNRLFRTESADAANWAAYTFTLAPAGRGQTQVELLGEFRCLGKHAEDEKRAKRLAGFCEKADGHLLARLKAHVEGEA